MDDNKEVIVDEPSQTPPPSHTQSTRTRIHKRGAHKRGGKTGFGQYLFDNDNDNKFGGKGIWKPCPNGLTMYTDDDDDDNDASTTSTTFSNCRNGGNGGNDGGNGINIYYFSG